MVESGIVLFSAAVFKQGKARKGASVFQNGAEFTIPVDANKRPQAGGERPRQLRLAEPESRAYHGAYNPVYTRLTRPHRQDTRYMKTSFTTQRGASSIVLIIILALLGAGVYIGLQYLPQYIEAGTVDSILGSVEKAYDKSAVNSVKSIQDMIDKQLNMNQMNDLKDNFKVTQDGEEYLIKVSYERELNLIYEKKPVKYEKTVILR